MGAEKPQLAPCAIKDIGNAKLIRIQIVQRNQPCISHASAIHQLTGFTIIKEISNQRTTAVVPQQTQLNRSLVELRSLTKHFLEGRETRFVIRRADATINQGEFVALAGPSGSGKTTLLNLIGGIDTPTDGEVIIDSTRINRLSETERTLFRRKNIGFVFQFFNLIPTLNVRENLLLPLQLNGYASAESERRIRKSLEQVGMADRIDSHPDRLSGGEQQRVAIARALVHDPLLILADEPTGNLDSNTGLVILSLLQSLIADSGKTLIVVSHSDMVVGAAKRVLAMENGELVERR